MEYLGFISDVMRGEGTLTSLNEERGEQKFKARKSLKRTLVTRQVLDWLRKERKYADDKYPVSTVEQDNGVLTDRNIDFVNQYLKRAQILGLDTLSGRQNLAKAMSTLFDYCQGAVYCHGDLPLPGVPSGEIVEWDDAVPVGE